VLAHYQVYAYAGSAAITRNPLGAGACFTVGPWGSDELHRALFRKLLAEVGLETHELPEGVRRSRLRGRGWLLNFGPETVVTAWGELPGYGVKRLDS